MCKPALAVALLDLSMDADRLKEHHWQLPPYTLPKDATCGPPCSLANCMPAVMKCKEHQSSQTVPARSPLLALPRQCPACHDAYRQASKRTPCNVPSTPHASSFNCSMLTLLQPCLGNAVTSNAHQFQWLHDHTSMQEKQD